MSDTHTKERTLTSEIAPAVERSLPDVEVLAVELLSPSRFCVYVDHPAGVDHKLCEDVTRLLDAYRGEYTIDVSSPGPARPVRKPSHFRLALGRRVAIRTTEAIGGKRRFVGAVAAADADAATIETAEGRVRIPYRQIVRGNLVDEG